MHKSFPLVCLAVLALVVSCGSPAPVGDDGDGGSVGPGVDVGASVSAGGLTISSAAQGAYDAAMAHLAVSRVSEAHDGFEEALALVPGWPQAAFGAGLTGLIMVTEEPAASSAMALLGDVPPAVSLIMGSSGWFARMAKGDSGKEGNAFLVNGMPWRGADDIVAVIDQVLGDTTGDDVVAQLVALVPALDEIASNMMTAASDPDFQITIDGGLISVEGPIIMDRIEALLLAAGVQIAAGVIEIVGAYDWGWTLQDAFGSHQSSQARIDAVNGRLLRLGTDTTGLEAAREHLAAGLDAIAAAMALAEDVKGTRPSAMAISLDCVGLWSFGHLKTLAEHFRAALYGPSTIPMFEPSTTLNLDGLFTAPFTAEDSDYDPIDEGNEWSTTGWAFVEGFWEDAIEGLFDPPVHEGDGNFLIRWWSWPALGGFRSGLCARITVAQLGWKACWDNDYYWCGL